VGALLTLVASAGPAAATTAVTLVPADSGRTITVDAGTSIEVILESNASTGFTWEVTTVPDGSVLAPVPGSGSYAEPVTDLVGAPGTQTFRYETVGAGTTRLGLTYQRPWSGEEAGTFTVTIIVEEPAESAMPATSTEASPLGGGLTVTLPAVAVLLALLSLIVILRGRLRAAA
jgi:inhibitor of cysteine peptidase